MGQIVAFKPKFTNSLAIDPEFVIEMFECGEFTYIEAHRLIVTGCSYDHVELIFWSEELIQAQSQKDSRCCRDRH